MDKKQLQQRVTEQRRRVRRRLTIRGVLSLLVVLTFIRCAFMQRYENMFVCVLSLVLLAMPTLIEKQLAIDIPPMMEAIIYCFIYAAEIMGEINSFYTIIPGWDTMLHTINGFLVAAVGFCLVDLFNRSERFTFKLSPLFLAIVAFCFSMTVGVLWEFFEFTADQVMHTDMQKDYVVHEVNSVSLNPDGLNVPVHVQIESVIVNGEDWTEQLGGYLDIGLIDTMKESAGQLHRCNRVFHHRLFLRQAPRQGQAGGSAHSGRALIPKKKKVKKMSKTGNQMTSDSV